MTCRTASRTAAGAFEGESFSRASHAASMVCCSSVIDGFEKTEFYTGTLILPPVPHTGEGNESRKRLKLSCAGTKLGSRGSSNNPARRKALHRLEAVREGPRNRQLFRTRA